MEARPLFAQVGRGQVNRNPFVAGEHQAAVADGGRATRFTTLAHRRIGQPDQRHKPACPALAFIHFDLYRQGFGDPARQNFPPLLT
jgi:hypothetical protein